MSCQGGAIEPPKYRMNVDGGLVIGADGNIADQRSHFDLLLDRNGLVLLGLPIEEGEPCAAQCADRGDLRTANSLFDRELLQATHCLVALLQDHGKGALAAVLMQQLA